MVNVDTSRAPRGALAAQELIVAITELGDRVERHFLEVKSTLDLTSKRDKEKIAKFILGASNRMPDVAASAFEGYAAMVIGVSQGSIVGIPPVEMMDIAKVVSTYVGVAGPRWDVLWVPIKDSANQVLVVLVEPPALGQAPFPCRANGDSLTSGRIYIRVEGETREANADEFDLLLKRGSAQPKAEVEFEFEVLGEVATFLLDDERTVEQYVSAKKRQLIAALPAPTGPGRILLGGAGYESMVSAMVAGTSFANAMYTPETRSEESYRASIDSWASEFRDSWSAARLNIAASQFSPIVMKITNHTSTFFQDVEVQIHLEGGISAFDYVDPESATGRDFDLPRPPRTWGPTERTHGLLGLSQMLYAPHPTIGYQPSVTFRNGGSVDLDLDVGDLRPRASYESEDEEFVLVVEDGSLTSIHGTWQLTARGHDAVYTGEFDFAVSDAQDVTEFARHVLELDD